ncbi:MAG: hypothetical protein DRP91_04425 [Candidatus Neomarinimicrobiota bacterium]|nr:MAG: hypothetical protein DRP91_04425 [Candidatus Neomarinimicrobiota bacterium]
MKGKSLSRKFFLCFLVIVLIVGGNGLRGAITGKIAGKVYDSESGKPLPGTNVIIVGTTLGASTDDNGYFFIIDVPPGKYSVAINYIGYEKVVLKDVVVSSGRTTELNVPLKPTTVMGKEVIVTAERPVVEKDKTASEVILTPEKVSQTWVRSLSEVLEIQPGIFRGHFRGGTKLESKYMLDNVSLNSGLLSDNYQGLNLTTVQEISVLTGGYNAEYGDAMSGIVNIITKEGVPGIHGTFLFRVRPPGKYHWGRYMYSKKNYDWQHFDLDWWTDQTNDPNSEFYGLNPDSLFNVWREVITPDPDQANYTKRAEYETEATIYGSPSSKLSFLLSGRYKRGVNVFPQVIPYNPEFNFQGKLSYNITPKLKITLNGLYGGYESASSSLPTNFLSIETAQEMAWNDLPELRDPYEWNKYCMKGAWGSRPELRRVKQFYIRLKHILSSRTYYNLTFSFLDDKMDRTDRYGWVKKDEDYPHQYPWSFDDDVFGPLGHYLVKAYEHWQDKWESKVYNVKGDISSQVNNNNLVKVGFDIKSYDFYYDHQMSAYEGGMRWNLMNVYDGKPYEGAIYAQDKIEFSGLILNAGLRLSFFDQNREAPKNMFDPLAYEATTPGNIKPGYPGRPEKERTKMQIALAPRLGISHPISENSVLHFMYGHFYQRPSWHKMFGFPYINFTEDWDKVYDPYDTSTVTYMDQWQGYYGNPKMGYEKTIQFEIGFDQNIADLALLSITGYYKDASRQTVFREATLLEPRWGDANTWTTLYNATNQYNVALMVSNCAYADIRGVELRLDTRFRFPLNFSLNYDLSYVSGGVVGYESMYEFGLGVNQPKGYGMVKKDWNSNHKFKGIMNLSFEKGYGFSILGFKPLSDLNMNLYYEYWSGQQYTYHGPDDPSTEPNNKRWFPHMRTNLKVSKGIYAGNVRFELVCEVRNLFNNYDINMLWWDDLVYFEENKDKPLHERLPKHWWSGEPNKWGWYNMWTNPPRQVYFQLQVDF